LFPWLSRRAGGGVLLRPQHSVPQGQPVRHASQIRGRDARRRGGGPSRRPGGQEGELTRSARSKMKPAPYGPFAYSPIIQLPRLTWPDGAHLALWVIPNIELCSLMEKGPAGCFGPCT